MPIILSMGSPNKPDVWIKECPQENEKNIQNIVDIKIQDWYLSGMFRLCSALFRTWNKILYLPIAFNQCQKSEQAITFQKRVWKWKWSSDYSLQKRRVFAIFALFTSKPNLSLKFRSYCSNGWLAVKSCNGSWLKYKCCWSVNHEKSFQKLWF